MVNIHEAKTQLSRYLEKVEQGETVLICKHNVPIAELKRIQKPLKDPRLIGLAKGEFKIPKKFFDPLPDDLLRLFNGRGK